MTSLSSDDASDDASWLVKLISRAIEGVGPLKSARELADDYRNDNRYSGDRERVDALIRWQASKNAATGFVNGLGGVLVLPVAIPGSLAASWMIQARMIAAIAELGGHDSRSDQVQTAILLCLIGNSAKEIGKDAGILIGGKLAISAIKKVPGKVLIEINKQVGFRLLTKFGERGAINLVRLVPLAGGVIGGGVDGTACYVVGQGAKQLFLRVTGRPDAVRPLAA